MLASRVPVLGWGQDRGEVESEHPGEQMKGIGLRAGIVVQGSAGTETQGRVTVVGLPDCRILPITHQ